MKKFCFSLALSTLGLGLACVSLGCNGSRSDPVECWEGAVVGSWTRLPYPPEHLGGDPGVSDGTTFSLILRHPVCTSCTLAELDAASLTWTTYETTGVEGEFNADAFSLTPGYLGATEFSNFDSTGWRIYSRTFALLDRAKGEWTTTEPPVEYESRWGYDLRWTGSLFLIWGGYVGPHGRTIVDDDTVLRSFSDGATYNPITDAWDMMPPAWPVGEHVYGKNPPQRQMSSVWTPQGLFVWGSNPAGTDTALAIFDLENGEWSYPAPQISPAPRRYHELSYHDGYVYLVGGFHGDDKRPSDGPNGPRELWRFALETLQWEQLDVPAYADLEVAKGSWLGDRLVLLGHRCASGSAFNAQTESWEPITGVNRPPLAVDATPSVGDLATAGDHLIVNQVSTGGLFTNSSVWIFEF